MKIKISEPTIEVLANIITDGAIEKKPDYRIGTELIDFFFEFGSTAIYSSVVSSPKDYTIKRLKEYNDKEVMRRIIIKALESVRLIGGDPNTEIAGKLDEYLQKDGYKLIPRRVDNLISDTGFTTYGDFLDFDVQPINGKTVEIAGVTELDHEYTNDQVQKAKEKLGTGDYDGAITSARSLIEVFQEKMIRKSGAEVPKYDGNLQKLYKVTKKTLNLDPSQKDLSDTLKQILTGLNSLVLGISGLSNKMGDRHSRSYKPSRHHAKLAVNAAFTFCEFLFDSYEYQQNHRIQKKSEDS